MSSNYASINPNTDQGPEVAPLSGLERDYEHQDGKILVPGIQNYHSGYPYSSNEPLRSSGNPFGLGPFLFGLLICVITTIIVGGAVGGGLGGVLASRHSYSPSKLVSEFLTLGH